MNSAFYGLPAKIANVAQAITIVGQRELHNLILAMSAAHAFASIPSELVNMSAFWHHSVYCAVVARLLASRCGLRYPSQMFTAGLLHDIGQPIIYHALPDLAREALKNGGHSNDVYRREQELMGFTHAGIGAEVMTEWRLPDNLCEAARFHHEPLRSRAYRTETAVVHIANGIANLSRPSRGPEHAAPLIAPEALQLTGFTPDIVEPMRAEADVQSLEILDVLFPGGSLVIKG